MSRRGKNENTEHVKPQARTALTALTASFPRMWTGTAAAECIAHATAATHNTADMAENRMVSEKRAGKHLFLVSKGALIRITP